MAHPKSRISKQRKRKRRTHKKAEIPTLNFCPETDQVHLRHRAYWHEGNMYYRGQVLVRGMDEIEDFE